MYGVTATNSPSFADSLVSINLNTGVATLIGKAGLPHLAEMAVNNEGDVYSWWIGVDDRSREDDLVKFNLVPGSDIGTATRAGITGLQTPLPTPPHSFGMDFDRIDDTKVHFLNGDGRYYTIRTRDAFTTFQGQIKNNNFSGAQRKTGSWTLNPDTLPQRVFWNLERTNDRVDVNTLLQTIDIDTLEATELYQTNVNGLDAIAFTFETTEVRFFT